MNSRYYEIDRTFSLIQYPVWERFLHYKLSESRSPLREITRQEYFTDNWGKARLELPIEEVNVVWPELKDMKILGLDHNPKKIDDCLHEILAVVFQWLADQYPMIPFCTLVNRNPYGILSDPVESTAEFFSSLTGPSVCPVIPRIRFSDKKILSPVTLNLAKHHTTGIRYFASAERIILGQSGEVFDQTIRLSTDSRITFEYGFNKTTATGEGESTLGDNPIEPNIFVTLAHEMLHLAGLAHVSNVKEDVMYARGLFGTDQFPGVMTSSLWATDLYRIWNYEGMDEREGGRV
ncbi:MAG TPA: hypothetical protein DHN29_21630 [Cytophagales bacterium]|nr:hypothetical protein [Cytophagales bacterium]